MSCASRAHRPEREAARRGVAAAARPQASDALEVVVVDGRVQVSPRHQLLQGARHLFLVRWLRKLAQGTAGDTLGLAVTRLAEEVHEGVPQLGPAEHGLLRGDLLGDLRRRGLLDYLR